MWAIYKQHPFSVYNPAPKFLHCNTTQRTVVAIAQLAQPCHLTSSSHLKNQPFQAAKRKHSEHLSNFWHHHTLSSIYGGKYFAFLSRSFASVYTAVSQVPRRFPVLVGGRERSSCCMHEENHGKEGHKHTPPSCVYAVGIS